MKWIVVIIVASALMGCMATDTEESISTPSKTRLASRYTIDAFISNEDEYNFRHYDAQKTRQFLAQISDDYRSGEIVEVDGLKWKKQKVSWVPYPNPPIPILEKGEDRGKHLKEYANWIDSHPHFGYPPLPMGNKR